MRVCVSQVVMEAWHHKFREERKAYRVVGMYVLRAGNECVRMSADRGGW